jgi:predicted nucleic acid-binding protein
MGDVLLDTDVFSYLMRSGDARAGPYRAFVAGKRIAVSFVTVGELLYGAEKRGWGAARRAELEARLRAAVVIPFDAEVCRAYARARAALPAGYVVAANDLWIAACALRHAMPLLTNNRRHFEQIGGLELPRVG